MSYVISRRDFLKASSALGLTAAVNPASAVGASGEKSRVVIATDSSCVSSTGNPDAAKIQDLIDHAIMTYTGKTTKGEAYEALFPAAVSSSTKIVLKRNDISGAGKVNDAVTNAMKSGLMSMKGGKFSGTVDIAKSANGASSLISAATYVINCPVAWMHSMLGVTLSLKNQMNYKGAPGASFHSNTSWLYQYVKDFKGKQILSLMDACAGNAKSGPGGSYSFAAGTVIVGGDLVAVDYNALRLLEKQTGANKSGISTGDSQLKTAETNGAGTCTPAKMEVIEIKAPWPSTGIYSESKPLMESFNIRVLNDAHRVEFIVPGGISKPLAVAIFDMRGTVVWQSGEIASSCIAWNKTSISGSRVPSGLYVFRIAIGTDLVRGTVMVKK
jgi:hypothetical protein